MRKHKFKYCTYTHSINGIVFYVGCGTYNRPYQKGRRGKDRSHTWFEIAESVEYKYDINIILESDSREDCLKKEVELTLYYKSIGQATANEKIGDNLSENHKKRISEVARTRTGINNPFYGKTIQRKRKKKLDKQTLVKEIVRKRIAKKDIKMKIIQNTKNV